MLPPSHEFRSRTQIFQPAFARTAAPTRELIPLPTNTASQESIAFVQSSASSNHSCLRVTHIGIRHRGWCDENPRLNITYPSQDRIFTCLINHRHRSFKRVSDSSTKENGETGADQ